MIADDKFDPELGYSPRDRLIDVPLSRQLMDRIARAGGNPHRLPGLLPRAPKLEARSGRFNARGRGARVAAGAARLASWTYDRASGLNVRPRRTFVQCRIVKPTGAVGGATYQHLSYLEREGVQRDGEPGRLFSTFTDEADRRAFLTRTGNDPHQFRLILSPESEGMYDDLKPFTRDVIARLEIDLDTTLDWVAADHYNTGHPHVHVVIRGVTEHGRSLNIAGDYLRFGIAHRASEVVTRDLGPKMEIEHQMGREVDAERLTDLDRSLMDRAENGLIDLTADNLKTDFDRALHQEHLARMRWLERMRLATPEKALQWHLAPNATEVLRDMGEQSARVNAMHRAVREANLTRTPQLYVHGDRLEGPITGSVIACDHPTDRQDRRYIVLDGIDGRTHYVDIGIEESRFSAGSILRVSPHKTGPRRTDKTIVEIAAANGGRYDAEIHLRSDRTATVELVEDHIRRLEEIDRTVGGADRQLDGSWNMGGDYMARIREYERRLADARPVMIDTLSTLPLSQQVGVLAATWLDRQLLGEVKQEIELYGFGHEVKEALLLRQRWLIDQGFIKREGDHIVYRGDLLERLRNSDVLQEGRKRESELQKPFVPTSPHHRKRGRSDQKI
jgi:type IV secretory pathway VirD2 relaxase